MVRKSQAVKNAEAKNGALHPTAMAIPAPDKTENPLFDGDQAAKHVMLQELVSGLIRDMSHVPDLYTRYKKRVSLAADAPQGAMAKDTMKPFTTARGMELDFLMGQLVAQADLTLAHLEQLRKEDEESTLQLMVFETQLPLTLKMLPDCQMKPVMQRIWGTRRMQCGFRLLHFVRDGGITDDYRLDWKKRGCYSPLFNVDGMLSAILHISGDRINIDKSGITNKFSLVDNYSDWLAAFDFAPQQPTPLWKFFKGSNKGPFRHCRLTSGCQTWVKLIEACAKGYKQELELTRDADDEVALKAKQVVNDFAEAKRTDQAAKARVTAAKAIAEKRCTRTFFT